MVEDISEYTKFIFTKETDNLLQYLKPSGDKLLFFEIDVRQGGGNLPPRPKGPRHASLPQALITNFTGDDDIRQRTGMGLFPSQISYPLAPLEYIGEDSVSLLNTGTSILAYKFGLLVDIGIGDWVRTKYLEKPDTSSQSWALSTDNGGVIALRTEEYYSKLFGAENEALMRLWILYHESAHILIPGAGVQPDATHPYSEAAPDAYAAIKMIQRFGDDAQSLISLYSWHRAVNAIQGDMSHLTSPVLDKILADSMHEDFSRLNSKDTLNRAEKYARDWTPDASIIEKAIPIFQRVVKDQTFSMTRLAHVCRTSQNDFAVYIAAKALLPFINSDGLVIRGEHVNMSIGKVQRDLSKIEARTRKMTLSSIFHKTATELSPTVAQTLSVTLPGRQKQLVYNP